MTVEEEDNMTKKKPERHGATSIHVKVKHCVPGART